MGANEDLIRFLKARLDEAAADSDPDVRRDAESRRQVLDMYVRTQATIAEYSGTSQPGEPAPHNIDNRREGLAQGLPALALPYSDHPDYREEWRP